MTTQEYAPGRRLDQVGSPEHGIAVLWHGRGVDGRAWMRPIADRVAGAGVMALAVDWDSEAADGGRTDLLTSLRFARDLAAQHGRDPDSVVVVGWSLGGTAAVSLAVHAKRLGVGIGGAVAVAPGDGPRVKDPLSGSPLPGMFPPGSGRCRIDLAYGERDPLSTPDLVTGLELRLRTSGWATSLHELDADHAEVVGTRFDERTEQYLPSSAATARASAGVVAGLVVAAATS